MLNSSPRKGWVLTQEAFDELLAWLNPDREQAARRYEDIRDRLIRILMHRGCTVAEELADKAINQVARKVVEVKSYYVGDPAFYFYGVARNIYNDYLKSLPDEVDVEPELLSAGPPEELGESEAEHDCLEKCLGELTPQNRDLILEYHREKEGAKIEHHKEMAKRLGITLNALRILMCRIRAGLKKCMRECLGPEAV
jgi:RNA polymerase sigma factor (sigma-70 family)